MSEQPRIIDHVPTAEELRATSLQAGTNFQDAPTEELNLQTEWSQPIYTASKKGLENSFAKGGREFATEPLESALAEVAANSDTPEQKSLETEVLANGTYKGHPVGLRELSYGAHSEALDRIWLSKVISNDPETGKLIGEHEVVGFHATSSVALAGLVESGALKSGRALQEEGKAVVTGAHDAAKGSSAISFGSLEKTDQNVSSWAGPERMRTSEEVAEELTNSAAETESLAAEFVEGSKQNTRLKHVAENFRQALAEFQADSNSLSATMMRNQFPMAIGIARSYVEATEPVREHGRFHNGQSYMGEFRPASENIPLEALPVIGVPKDKVEAVKKLLEIFKHDNVVVVPLESLRPNVMQT